MPTKNEVRYLINKCDVLVRFKKSSKTIIPGFFAFLFYILLLIPFLGLAVSHAFFKTGITTFADTHSFSFHSIHVKANGQSSG